MKATQTATGVVQVVSEGAVESVQDGRAHAYVKSTYTPAIDLSDIHRAIVDGRPLGILCATWGETVPFIRRMEVRREVRRGPRSFFEGTLGGIEVVVACAGVGKVNAAMGTQQLIDAYPVWAAINAGAAGAVSERVDLFDIAVITESLHHDVPSFVLPDSYPYYDGVLFMSSVTLVAAAHHASEKWRTPFKWARTATGECFVDDSNRERIVVETVPDTVDMETAAMAQVCAANAVPFIAVRCITDTPALSGFDSYAKHADEASEYACQATELVLEELVRFAAEGARKSTE